MSCKRTMMELPLIICQTFLLGILIPLFVMLMMIILARLPNDAGDRNEQLPPIILFDDDSDGAPDDDGGAEEDEPLMNDNDAFFDHVNQDLARDAFEDDDDEDEGPLMNDNGAFLDIVDLIIARDAFGG